MIRILAQLAAPLTAILLSTAANAANAPAAEPIQALDQGLLAAMHAGKAVPFAERYAALAPIVQRTFDLSSILETSVGNAKWQAFTPDQQQQLMTEFVRFTVASYVANFSSFGGEKFEISPDTRAVGAEQVVDTRIVPVSGDVAKLSYVMRQEDTGWRAVDVLLDGTISRVAVQRSDFRSLVGNGPEPLIDSLRRKVANLSGGAGVP